MVTVQGTASDNVAVSNVWCQLNGSGWIQAASANNWTNWAATDVTLRPGLNAVQAYLGGPPAGTHSTTSSVSLVYVVSDRLRVQATGQGTLTPNYSNAMLEIGRDYRMTAIGVNGHTLAPWVISTNWAGGAVVTDATLHFQMQSNLTVQANFVDVARPTLTIVSPTPGQRLSNAVVTVQGTASDNAQVGGPVL